MPFPSPSHLEFFGSALDVVMREFRDLYAQLTGWLSKEHNGDGTHAHVTAYDVTVNEFVGFAETGARVTAGTGSPEGVVAAPPGSVWLEDDGGSGAVVWLKETGTAADGWVALGTGTGGGAPVDAQYVTLASDPTLSQERVLTAGTGIAITDGGANGPVTIASTVSGGAPISGSFVTMSTDATLTSERVLTAGSGIAITDGGANSTVTIAATTPMVQAQYVTLAADAGLTSERVLTAGTNITITDSGSTVTIASTGGGGTGDMKTAYASVVTMTVTNLHSLAVSTTTGWQSAVVDNTTDLYLDALVHVVIDFANTAPGNSRGAFVFAYGGIESGVYSNPASGTEGAITLIDVTTTAQNLKPIGFLPYTTTNEVAESAPMSVAAAFGGVLPPYWGVVIMNHSGAAFAASGNTVKYRPVYATVT